MSDIDFACPLCQQPLEAPEEMAGQTIECPACSQPIAIPAAELPVPAANDIPQPLAPTLPSEMLAATRRDNVSASQNSCPECGTEMAPETVLCVQCGFHSGLGKKIDTCFE